MSTESAIVVECVSYAVRDHIILDDVSLVIPHGEYVGLIGPNGGGKTTLMKIILGLVKPDSGTVRIFGLEPHEARKGGVIGYVPQRIVQSDSMFPATVEEVVKSGLSSSAEHRHDPSCITRAMELTNVAHYKDRLVSQLSGGERQRVFIARALAAHPKILLLDEPTTGVDVASQEAFYALLKKLNTDLNLTIIFVSHDIDIMMREASSIAVLNQKLLCNCDAKNFPLEGVMKDLYGSRIPAMHHHHPHTHA